MESINEFILIRDVGLDATGKLDHKSLQLASRLKIPHWLPVQALLGTASTGAVPAVFVLIFKGEGDFS